MVKKIFISTSSFGIESSKPIQLLQEAGIHYSLNPLGRKLSKEETVNLLQEVDGVVAGTETYSRDVLEKLPRLRVISRCGAGTDGIDREYLQQKDISLLNTPNVHVTAVAELTLAGLFSLSRKVSQGDALMKAGKWEKLMGTNLGGKTVALIGLGRVGKEVANVLIAMRCRVLGFDPYFKGTFPAGVEHITSLDRIWQEADVISLHLPATEEARHLVRQETLLKCKPTVMIVNTSRGELVNEGDLIEFLNSHPQAGAYIDVYEKEPYSGPLATLPNVIVTPHVGTFTKETRVSMEIEAVQNIIHYFNSHA